MLANTALLKALLLQGILANANDNKVTNLLSFSDSRTKNARDGTRHKQALRRDVQLSVRTLQA